MPDDIRTLLIEGNINPEEIIEVVKLVRQLRDRRPKTADFRMLVVDQTATFDESAARLKDTLKGFTFRVYPSCGLSACRSSGTP